jgi:transcriptional regulator with XRE-family HTH domain
VKLGRLREWRQSEGLMQKELAAAAGINELTVLRAERGDSIRVNTARKLADALDVTVADLMEEPPVPLVQAR